MASMLARTPLGREGCIQKKRLITNEGLGSQVHDDTNPNRTKKQRLLKVLNDNDSADHPKEADFSLKLCPHDCGDYIETIYSQKFAMEKQYVLTEPVFASIQNEIDGSIYLQLIGYFYSVCQEQSLEFSTLILSLHIFDQVLAKCRVAKRSALLVCSACITLASKIEEIYPVDVEKLSEMTKYSFSKDELFSMEKQLFSKLGFQIALPTREQFALYYSRHFQFTTRQQQLLSFFILLSFVDYNFNYVSMSMVAASATLLVLQMTQPDHFQELSFRKSFERITGYTLGELVEPLLRLRKVHEFRYDFPHIQSICDAFSTPTKEEVNSLYDAINYKELYLGENVILPVEEKDFAFVERALETNPPMVSTRKAEQERKKVSELPTFQQQLKPETTKVKIAKPSR